MEHISIEINKDFGRYKHNFFLGYTLSECFFFFLGALCCILIILPLGLWLHLDLFIAGWCGVIPASAIIYIGNHQRDGMSEIEYQKKIYALKKMKSLSYSSEETQEAILELLSEGIKQKEKEENKEGKIRKINLSKIVKMTMSIGVIIGAIVTTIMIVPHKVKQKQVAEVKQETIRSQVISKDKTDKKSTEEERITTEKQRSTTEIKKEKKQSQTSQSKKESTIQTRKVEQVTEVRKEPIQSTETRKRKEISRKETKSTTKRKKITITASKPKTIKKNQKKTEQKVAKTTEKKKTTSSKVSSTQESQFEIEYETK